jgi:dynein heavy chain
VANAVLLSGLCPGRFDNEQPEVAKLPGDYEKNLNDFERLILLRALRPDRITTALRTWIGKTMGPDYIFQKPFDMAATFEETGNNTPMFFVLFPGVDPTPWVEGLGKTMGISSDNNTFINISMGQGQEKPAEAWVERFAKEGGWVMLQNCHLMQSWVRPHGPLNHTQYNRYSCLQFRPLMRLSLFSR